jgi:hypothetical protein
MGDRGYRGCEYVEVCESKEQKGIRQVVEGVNSQIKLFNRVSRWRKGITLLAYLYGYTIGYSFFRKSQIWGEFLTRRIERYNILDDLASLEKVSFQEFKKEVDRHYEVVKRRQQRRNPG